MFGKVPEDSFQNIFDLSFDSEDNKCVVGSRSLDVLSSLSSLNNHHHNNNNNNRKNTSNHNAKISSEETISKSWRNAFMNSNSDEFEHAFAKLYTNQKEPSSSAQDAFASSFFPFSLNSLDKSKTSDVVDNSCRKKLLYSAALSNSGSSASSTCSSTSPSATSGSLPASKVNTSRYKTELCRPYQENGSCKYGEKCQFAHGMPDLRSVNRHPKYKTDLCRTYHSVGFCPYGPRCHFIHSLDELTDGAKGTSSVGCVSPAPSTASSSATPHEIAAAIAALKQLPLFAPERISAPPGFGPARPHKNLESLGLSGLGSSESSGFSSANSLSPSLLSDLDDSQARLPVFSRFSH